MLFLEVASSQLFYGLRYNMLSSLFDSTVTNPREEAKERKKKRKEEGKIMKEEEEEIIF